MFTDVLSAQQPHQVPAVLHSYPRNMNRRESIDTTALATAESTTRRETKRDRFRHGVPHSQQYLPHSTERATTFSTQRSFADPQSSNRDDVEHMLRRKTPNGTLAAGYDGDPADLDARPHAAKQLLIPLSQGPGFASNWVARSRDYTDRLLPSQLDHSYPPQPGDRRGQSNGTGFQGRIQSELSQSLSGAAAYQGQGVDSVLNQGAFFQHAGNLMNGQHIPTVLQPMWPPCIGLTSRNNVGPYGPYWPDGAFEPYRPAPVRDPRYYQQAGIDNTKRVENASDMPWPSSYDFSRQPHYQEPLRGSASDPRYPQRWHPAEIGRTGQHGHYPFRQAPVIPRGQTCGSPVILGLSPFRDEQDIRDHRGIADLQSKFNGGSNQPDLQGSNAQFKEKVLTWAHRIYVSLLTNIHHPRGNDYGQHPGERHFSSSVYPKPPRQQPYHSYMETSQGPVAEGKHQTSMLKPEHENLLDAQISYSKSYSQNHPKNVHRAADIPRESLSPWSKTWNQPLQIRRQQHPLRQTIQSHSFNPYSYSESANSIQKEQKRISAEAAVNAIEMLSRLCSESGWQWTDGMLLGGCLAYGLGDLSRALKWYCKVLNCDPKYLSHILFQASRLNYDSNVEAISNLAATLLALGRRGEAEQQWRRSIKLRPSYFEAVEHLIGLFCEDRRGKEAVKIIDFVQQALRITSRKDAFQNSGYSTESGSEGSLSPDTGLSEKSDFETSDLETYENRRAKFMSPSLMVSVSSGYAIPACDNGRMLALVHGKGNMLYALGDNAGAAKAFEDAILIGSGRRHLGIQWLIKKISKVFAERDGLDRMAVHSTSVADEPILLIPEVALETSQLVFPPNGQLPGLADIASGIPKKAAMSIISNSLLSLAKIYQDGMSSSGATTTGPRATSGVQDILALYYLSLSLQPSPSTANNVGILLASVQQSSQLQASTHSARPDLPMVPGVVRGSGVALALAYYNYGLNLDSRHAHLYTNLGSLFKDIGQLDAAIKMYEKAVECDGKFDIALANLANAVKDRGRISDAISYYRKAVSSNPDFAEAVCGLANALNSVCSWGGRGGIKFAGVSKDRWHVDDKGMLYDARQSLAVNVGWIGRVVAIVDKQLKEGESWGQGVIQSIDMEQLLRQLSYGLGSHDRDDQHRTKVRQALHSWGNRPWEGARLVRLIERATKRLGWHFYRRKYIHGKECKVSHYARPQMPSILAIPSAPTVLPFHTFTCPLTAKQIRQISQRNGLRISCSTLRAPWLPAHIYEPPKPPRPHLNVGYVSSDFNNHPLAHLMQSVFGFHDKSRVQAFCYATTASDNSSHRQQIEEEAPAFLDASSWSIDRLVKQIVADDIHILINLNGYTRGARNEVFAARPAPIQMSFMGFAGTLGAEWCDYLLADKIAIPPSTLRPNRCNVDLLDQTRDGNIDNEEDGWVYGENIIFTRDTFFCCDHRQSAPDAQEAQLGWHDEQRRRWMMRKKLFPDLGDNTIILGNFNQLYKIEPTTFRTWLRILSRLPNAILWLLRFPDLGEINLKHLAVEWVGSEVAERIIFTDVAPKSQHIARARVCDLFLDTPECNAHTTAADVLWSGTPLLTLPRYEYKMCSRIAASILTGALPKTAEGERAAKELIARSDDDYEERAVELGSGLVYPMGQSMQGYGKGRLVELRKLLYESRRTSALFDTRRWVRDLENAYGEAWSRWIAGVGGDIWL